MFWINTLKAAVIVLIRMVIHKPHLCYECNFEITSKLILPEWLDHKKLKISRKEVLAESFKTAKILSKPRMPKVLQELLKTLRIKSKIPKGFQIPKSSAYQMIPINSNWFQSWLHTGQTIWTFMFLAKNKINVKLWNI